MTELIGSATVHPEWERWISENIRQGATRREVVDVLLEQGVSKADAQINVDRVSSATTSTTADAPRWHQAHLSILNMLSELEKTRKTPIRRCATISPIDFFDHYYSQNRPLVIQNFASEWAALKKWTPGYFDERFGHKAIEVCVGRSADAACDENFENLKQTMLLREFIQKIERVGASNDFYMIANNRVMEDEDFLTLLNDVRLDDTIFDLAKSKTYVSLWLGPKGTVTSLHHDQNNIMFTQIFGSKRFKLISPLETNMLLAARNFYSDVDPEQPDLEKYPWWNDVTVHEVDVGPGEAIFIPIGWWHHVRSLSPSISISFLNFRASNNFDWYFPGFDVN